MSFNPKEHFATCAGGVLDQCVIQDGRFYEPDGTEVNEDRKPVQKSAQAKPAKAAAKDESQVKSQLSE